VPHLFVLRILTKLAALPVKKQAPQLQKLLSLQNHLPCVSSPQHRRLQLHAEWLWSHAHQLAPCLGITSATVQTLLAVVHCNAHTLYSGEQAQSGAGVGLYPGAACRLNHACRPSAEFYNLNLTLHVRTLHEVVAGAEVTVSYIPVSLSAGPRRRMLASQYNFCCHCPRCVLEVPGLSTSPLPTCLQDPCCSLPTLPQPELPEVIPSYKFSSDWRFYYRGSMSALEQAERLQLTPLTWTGGAVMRLEVAFKLSSFAKLWRLDVRKRRRDPSSNLACQAESLRESHDATIQSGEDEKEGGSGNMTNPENCVKNTKEVEAQLEMAEIKRLAFCLLEEALRTLQITRGKDHHLCCMIQLWIDLAEFPFQISSSW